MSAIDEAYVIKQYGDSHSTYSIAKELGTYPKKIERILKKNGHKLRGKAEAQSLAIKSGRTKMARDVQQAKEKDIPRCSKKMERDFP